MTNTSKPATRQQIIDNLLDQLGPDHPLTTDVTHGFLHFPPYHIDIVDGKLQVSSEHDQEFNWNIFINQENLKDIHLIVLAAADKLNDDFANFI